MDKYLTMENQVNSICKSTMYHIRQVGRVRKYLDKPTTEKLIHAVITSRLDYANSLLYGITSSHSSRIQRIQNTAARIVSLVSKHTSATQLRKDLHWLPIRARIDYKILILVFRALNSGTPSYISDIVKHQTRNRPVRSRHLHQLQTPTTNTKAYGDRCLVYAAPRLWNALPPNHRCIDQLELFKYHLKTFLFSSCY